MDEHWLTRPKTIKQLWVAFGAVLTASVLAELWIRSEPHFAIERIFGFHAVYGLLSCAVMIVAAKALGLLLKRPDTHYDERGDD